MSNVEYIDRGMAPIIVDLDYHTEQRPIPTTVVEPVSNRDSFGRFRTAEPYTLFDSKLLSDKRELFWNEVINGTGASATYANSALLMSVTSNGEFVIRQTYEKFNYQPGKSQFIFLTGVLSTEVNVLKRYGYFSSSTTAPHTANLDGYWFENDGTGLSLCIGKSGSISKVAQEDWNIDTLDGNGVSGVTIDLTKNQIFFIQFEWLGVGSAWFGVVIDGVYHYVHRFDHANESVGVYCLSPNQPVRAEIRSTGGSGTLLQICASVISEGGIESNGILRSTSRGSTHIDANVVGTRYASQAIKLKSNYRYTVIRPEEVSALVITTGDVTLVEVILNPTVSGVMTYTDETNSAVQTAIGSTSNVVAGGYVLSSWYATTNNPTNDLKNTVRYIGETISGVMDTLVLAVTPIVGTNQDIYTALSWRELS